MILRYLFCVAQLLNNNAYTWPSLPTNDKLATAHELSCPTSVVPDGVGGCYVSCVAQNKVFHVTAEGKIRLVAGSDSEGYSGDGGQATLAQLKYPRGIALDSAGNLYISDSGNNRVRKVTRSGVITTVVGDGQGGFSKANGGQATSARMHYPESVAIDSTGNLYITDSQNLRICKVNTAGMITTVADIGPDELRGGASNVNIDLLPFNYYGIAIDSAGNVLFSDTFNNCIRKVTPAGAITIIAGNGDYDFGGDGGQATAAQLSNPSGIAMDPAGNLYIADTYNNRIRKVTSLGVITTIAGNGNGGFSGDGGQATAAQLREPRGVAVDSAGNLYIADFLNNRVRKVTPAGVITTLDGNGEGK
jgi:sugar lactone lactonase YvrE